ncbi:MAG: hypothetical protein RIT81_43395 [Deltaproteobacteria bacterium]
MYRPLTQRILLVLWLVLGAGLRLLALPPTLGDLDAANFAAALERFDPTHQAPHWPAYPVYVLASKGLHALGLTPAVALGLVGVVAFVAAAPVFFAGLSARFDRTTAHVLTAAVSLAPGAVVSASWAGTEGLGLALLLAQVGVALRTPPARDAVYGPVAVGAVGAVGALAGLGLGVRLSWWPLYLGVLAAAAWASHRTDRSDRRDGQDRPDRRSRHLLAGLAAGTASWLVPLVVIVGPDALVGFVGFATGHFTTWGGAISADDGALERTLVAGDAIAAGFGGALPFVGVFVAAVVGLAVRNRRPALAPLALPAAIVAAYAVWCFLAQNVARPRHTLPIAVALLLALAFVVAHRGRRWAAVPIGAVLIAAAGHAAWIQGRTLPPYAQAALHVQTVAAQEPVQVFAGRQGRLLERLIPGVRLWRPATAAVLAREAAAAHRRGATVFVLDDAPGAELLETTEALTFETQSASRGPDARVVLYRYSNEENRVASR